MDTQQSPLVENVTAAVAADGRTARAISLAAGVRHDTIRNLTTGRSKRPGAETLAALAREFKTTPEALLGYSAPPLQVQAGGVEVFEYDIRPMVGLASDPKTRPIVGRWVIPHDIARGGEFILVRCPASAGRFTQGERILVDVSESGRLKGPYGFLVWHSGAYDVAVMERSEMGWACIKENRIEQEDLHIIGSIILRMIER